VAIYTDSRQVVPLKAEEGLSGRIQPKLRLHLKNACRHHIFMAHDIDMMPDADGKHALRLASRSISEGRALVLDFGLFVLINLYCPNETSDAQLRTRHERVVPEGRRVAW